MVRPRRLVDGQGQISLTNGVDTLSCCVSETATVVLPVALDEFSAHLASPLKLVFCVAAAHIAVTPSVVAVVFAPTVQSVPGLTFLPSSSATSLWIETLAVSGELVIVQTTSLPEFGMVTVPEVPVPEAPLIALSSTVQE